nr:hypothetical protein HmN_000966600 [Hymenolepis microstoma]
MLLLKQFVTSLVNDHRPTLHRLECWRERGMLCSSCRRGSLDRPTRTLKKQTLSTLHIGHFHCRCEEPQERYRREQTSVGQRKGGSLIGQGEERVPDDPTVLGNGRLYSSILKR